MIRLVAFDFDGTLVDSNDIKERCLFHAIRGIPDGLAALEKARQVDGDRYRIFDGVARYVANGGSAEAIAAQSRLLVGRYSECCERGIAAAAERRGARRALIELRRRKLSLWVVSATPTRDLVPVLRRRGLLRLFDGAFGGHGAKVKTLRKILARTGQAPHETLFVGDGPDDRAAARAVGVQFVAITSSGKLDGRGAFAMADLRKLVPLIDRLTPVRRVGR